jgi:hypothetical protein
VTQRIFATMKKGDATDHQRIVARGIEMQSAQRAVGPRIWERAEPQGFGRCECRVFGVITVPDSGLKVAPHLRITQGVVELGGNIGTVGNRRKAEMTPAYRRCVHFESAANGQLFFGAVFVNEADISQHLANPLDHVLAGLRHLVLVPVAELRQAHKSGFLLNGYFEAGRRPGCLSGTQDRP